MSVTTTKPAGLVTLEPFPGLGAGQAWVASSGHAASWVPSGTAGRAQ